jgi:hypothetical protein
MPGARLPMRKLRELLRLHAAGLPGRQTAKRRGYKIFAHSGEGLSQMCAWLIAITGAECGRINVGIEVPHARVAPGTTEAAVAHVRALVERLRLVESQLRQAHGQLDRSNSMLAEPATTDGPKPSPGQASEQRDAAIFYSLPGVGRITLATLLAEAWDEARG